MAAPKVRRPAGGGFLHRAKQALDMNGKAFLRAPVPRSRRSIELDENGPRMVERPAPREKSTKVSPRFRPDVQLDASQVRDLRFDTRAERAGMRMSQPKERPTKSTKPKRVAGTDKPKRKIQNPRNHRMGQVDMDVADQFEGMDGTTYATAADARRSFPLRRGKPYRRPS